MSRQLQPLMGAPWQPLVVVAALIGGVLIASGCGRRPSLEGSPHADEGPCAVAESIGEFQGTPSRLPDCGSADNACRAACRSGDAASCLSAAYTLEQEPSTAGESKSLFRRACLLGLANACTNYAARIWSGEHSDAELACAGRIFEKACAAREAFSCGMVGRLRLEAAVSSDDFARAQQHLERSCEQIGGFPCRVLAMHLEVGDFGPYPEERIPTLLEQACEGGDPDGCGNPGTATETFDWHD